MAAVGREDIREDGAELRSLGQRLLDLSEEMRRLAQAYRNLYEQLRLAQRPGPSVGAAPTTGHRTHREASPGHRGTAAPTASSLHRLPRTGSPAPPAGFLGTRESLRNLLDRQGDLGQRISLIARHPLFMAGGDDPRKIMVRLNDLGARCQDLRTSSDGLVRGTPRSVLAVIDDLCEINSEAAEGLVRIGQGLRLRGDGVLAGKKSDRRYLRGDGWRTALV